jgi:hypothetical protein
LQVGDRRVHVVGVQRDVVASDVAVARLRALVLVRFVLEHLEVQPEPAPVEPDLAHHAARVHVEVRAHPVVVVPHLRQRVHVIAAQHVDEEVVRLRHVRDRDADVVAAAQAGDALASRKPSIQSIASFGVTS